MLWPRSIAPVAVEVLKNRTKPRVWDNGWILELDPDVLQAHARTMEISPSELSAERVFDQGFATWVGITPDDSQQRDRERAEIQSLPRPICAPI